MTDEQYINLQKKIDTIMERTSKMDAELQRIRLLLKMKGVSNG